MIQKKVEYTNTELLLCAPEINITYVKNGVHGDYP